MKTILEWIQELPEPIRTRAMVYRDEDWDENVNSIDNAIFWAFTWDDTSEGDRYWNSVFHGQFDQAEQLLKEATK